MAKITIRHANVRKFPCGETLWATKVGLNLYKLCNIPIFTEKYSLGDLVETNDELVVLGRIERCARTYHLSYDGTGKTSAVKKRLRGIQSFLDKVDIKSEPGIAGVLSIAVPLDINKKKLELILASCDEPLSLLTVAQTKNLVTDVFM